MFRKRKENNTKIILEGCHIRGNRKICMHLNDGLNISAQYGEREGKEKHRKERMLWEAGPQYSLKDCRA